MSASSIPVYRLGPTDCITLDGVPYRRRDRLTGGYILARVDDPAVALPFSHAQIHELAQRPGYRFERGLFDPGIMKARVEGGGELLSDVPRAERPDVDWRHRICSAFLKLEAQKQATRSDRGIKAAILGMKMGFSPNARLALETLEMVVSPKTALAKAAGAISTWDHCGSPEEVIHDQAKSFLSTVFRRAVIDLEAEPDSPPAGMPQMRGTIERLNKTMATQALAPFTGRTFGSVGEKGDYKPEERISLELPDLCRVLVRWAVDVYHNSPHAGLGGETPANAWNRLVAEHGLIPPPDSHTRRAIFGVEIDRVLSAKGVRVLGLFFNCIELQAFRRERDNISVEVRVDPMDLGHVSVRLGDAGWLAVPCMRPGFDAVTVETWRLASADLRRRFLAEARLSDDVVCAAIRDALEVAAQAQARAGILSTRPTREELDREEEKLGIGFPDPRTDSSAPSALGADLTAFAIPAGRGLTALPSSPTPPSRGRGRAIKMKD